MIRYLFKNIKLYAFAVKKDYFSGYIYAFN